MSLLFRITMVMVILVAFSAVYSSTGSPESGIGIEAGGAWGDNAGKSESWVPSVRAHYQLKLARPLLTQIGFSYTPLNGGNSYSTKTALSDIRLLIAPIRLDQMFPYIYTGFGVAKDVSRKDSDILPVIPFGIGLQTRLGKQLIFQLNGGYNLALSDDLDGVKRTTKLNRFTNKEHDGFFSLNVGLIYTAAPKEKVVVKEFKPIEVKSVDVALIDTDGDGLTDQDEINIYKTDPNNPDTDGDGLSDGDEVMKYRTDPLKWDTDGDGLSDGDEVLKYKTDPNNPDTDGDGLSDGDEVLIYKTDPLKKDTDGDGLSDGDEVLIHKTDPLKIDTDGGGMHDGAEIRAGKNPLDPSDDLIDLTKGKKIVLHGIHFATNKSEISQDSAPILEKVRESMVFNPDATIIISGHTDSVGSDESNRTLSQLRAQAVKDWLVSRKISAARIKVIGKGSAEPTATNDTAEGRAKNRRIEFLVE